MNTNSYQHKLLLLAIALTLVSCDNKQATTALTPKNSYGFKELTLSAKEKTNRWYYREQADRGQLIFTQHCAICHGKRAQATPDWQTPNANGHYPPPPLNGSAHAWHHPLQVLGSTIYNGGIPVGGQMPAFKGQLSETDIIDVVAHFQSYWSDEIYQRWLEIEKSTRQ